MPDFLERLRIELSGRRLAYNAVFHGLHLFLFAWGWYTQQTNERLAALNGLRFSVWTSRGAGLVLAFDGGLILVPMLRNLIRIVRPKLRWLFPADENVWFHRQVAYSMLFWTIVHTTAHYVNFINVERTQVRKQTAWEIHYAQPGGVTGHVMLLLMFLMYTTAHRKIRTTCFEAFWYTHHLAFVFLMCLYTHATGCFVRDSVEPDFIPTFPFYSTEHCLGYESWRFIIWTGLLYFAERVLREVRARRPTAITKVLLHPAGVMEIRFTKPSMDYRSGQWLFLQVPAVSRFQWHPFTITSAPDDPYISVHIRQVGDFTEQLGTVLGAPPTLAAQLTETTIKAREKQTALEGVDALRVDGLGNAVGRGDFIEIDGDAIGRTMPKLRVDGPFGGTFVNDESLGSSSFDAYGTAPAPAEDVFSSEVAVLVAGGIGITPFASILRHIWYLHKRRNLASLRKVEFIWICRDTGSFGWFQTLLAEMEEALGDTKLLKISIYLTKRLSQDDCYNISLNSVGQQYDPLTLLRTRTLFGRPRFDEIFPSLTEAIEKGGFLPGREASLRTKIGVYFCGPSDLAKVVKREALACSTETVEYTFAKEHFS